MCLIYMTLCSNRTEKHYLAKYRQTVCTPAEVKVQRICNICSNVEYESNFFVSEKTKRVRLSL